MYEGIDRILKKRRQSGDAPQEVALAKKFPGKHNLGGTRCFGELVPTRFRSQWEEECTGYSRQGCRPNVWHEVHSGSGARNAKEVSE